MLDEGNLIYFTPFRFPDGKTEPKPKFFIVLKNVSDKIILASLPTRRDNVPASRDGQLGCIEFTNEVDGFDMACYRIGVKDDFLEGVENPFHKETHLYGSNLKHYAYTYFDEYPFEGVDYVIVGKIKRKVFKEMVECFKTNKAVKRGYQQMLLS